MAGRDHIMYKVAETMLTEEQIQNRVKEMGLEISKDYEGESLVAVCTLKGAMIFMSDLVREIPLTVTFDTIAASSYGSGTESSGVVTIKKDLDMSIEGKNVLIVEDIIDSGRTLKALKEKLLERNPKSVKIATFLDKPSRRQVEVDVDYIGFTVEDKFIVGYGLDYDEQYRNLPYITCLEEE